MTITLPLRRMTLHFSQIGFTEGLTFMFVSLPNAPAPDAPRAISDT
jgi:hypothetical protein